jgi:phosphotransferase system HPr-like phosphotransfer protein
MVNYSVVVNNPVGLHARPAADLLKQPTNLPAA